MGNGKSTNATRKRVSKNIENNSNFPGVSRNVPDSNGTKIHSNGVENEDLVNSAVLIRGIKDIQGKGRSLTLNGDESYELTPIQSIHPRGLPFNIPSMNTKFTYDFDHIKGQQLAARLPSRKTTQTQDDHDTFSTLPETTSKAAKAHLRPINSNRKVSSPIHSDIDAQTFHANSRHSKEHPNSLDDVPITLNTKRESHQPELISKPPFLVIPSSEISEKSNSNSPLVYLSSGLSKFEHSNSLDDVPIPLKTRRESRQLELVSKPPFLAIPSSEISEKPICNSTASPVHQCSGPAKLYTYKTHVNVCPIVCPQLVRSPATTCLCPLTIRSQSGKWKVEMKNGKRLDVEQEPYPKVRIINPVVPETEMLREKQRTERDIFQKTDQPVLELRSAAFKIAEIPSYSKPRTNDEVVRDQNQSLGEDLAEYKPPYISPNGFRRSYRKSLEFRELLQPKYETLIESLQRDSPMKVTEKPIAKQKERKFFPADFLDPDNNDDLEKWEIPEESLSGYLHSKSVEGFQAFENLESSTEITSKVKPTVPKESSPSALSQKASSSSSSEKSSSKSSSTSSSNSDGTRSKKCFCPPRSTALKAPIIKLHYPLHYLVHHNRPDNCASLIRSL